ncbi:MAG: protein TolR [Rickettsiaceae bacterium]
MAMIISKNNKNRGKRRLMSEINVTPMVDVMLVLLIIFMITSPMLVTGVQVDLPKTKSAPISGQDKPISIDINKQGEIFILETKIPAEELIAKLENIAKEQQKDTQRIFIRADKTLSYDKVFKIITKIQNAGFTKLALVSDLKI